jgi:drug/metabolite transporter (DMT)-like permease
MSTDSLHTRSDRSAELLLLLVVFIWAANYPVTKFGLERLDIYIFNSIRFIVAFGLLVSVFVAKREWFTMPRADRNRLFRLGLIVSIFYQMAFIVGMKLTSPGNVAVILSTSPLWTAIFSARINRERILPQTLLGMAVSLVGIFLIILGSGKQLEFGSTALYGDLVSLLAAALWALNTNLQKPLLARYSTVQISVVTLGIGAVGLSLIAVPSAVAFDWKAVPAPYYVAAVLSGALSIGTANVLWSYGVKRLGPSRTANFNNLVPVFAFLISFIALNDRISAYEIVGAAVTIAGVMLARRR